MSEPVVFISHFGIKEGALDDLKRLSADVFDRLRGEKPRTVLFLAYLDEEGTEVSFLHAFPDGVDGHPLRGRERKSGGRVSVPGASRMGDLRATQRGSPGVERRSAETAGVSLTVLPDQLGGFLRLQPA